MSTNIHYSKNISKENVQIFNGNDFIELNYYLKVLT